MIKFLIRCLIVIGSYAHAIEPRTVTYYADKLTDFQRKVFTDQKIPIDNKAEMTAMLKTSEGLETYVEALVGVYQVFFKDWLYLQHLYYGDNVYALYFTVSGFEDMSLHVIEFSKNSWREQETLPSENQGEGIRELFWNYDEAEKNVDDLKLFVKQDLLVLSRSGLCHSLYDLKENKILFNEVSPWNAADKAGEDMNAWIKTNLHNKIDAVLSAREKTK